MYSWRSCIISGNRAWTRLLGDCERGFYYDGEFCGTADVLHHVKFEVATQAKHLINRDHFTRTWNRLKRRYPLLAVRVEELDDDRVQFVVEEKRLDRLVEGEFTFRLLDEVDLPDLVEDYYNGPRKLSRGLLASMEILLHSDLSGSPSFCSVMFNIAHCISDGASSHNALKTFLDFLVSPPDDLKDFHSCDERLAMVPPTYTLYMGPNWSLARQRWKLAIAWACLQYRSRILTGGHTLPRRRGVSEEPKPSTAKDFWVTLDRTTGLAILENCRRHGVTFGHALYVLYQIAHSIVLHRRRDEFPVEEWDFRLKQPMHFGCPVNPRPYLDSEWLSKGGGTELFAAVTYANVSLPCMPRISGQGLHYDGLMTKEAFWHRCYSVKRQWSAFLNHPLMLQIAAVSEKLRIPRKKAILQSWRAQRGLEVQIGNLQSALQGDNNLVFSNGGSSFGALELRMPHQYPLNSTHNDSPSLTITYHKTYLRSRWSELYSISSGRDGSLSLGCWWDGNVFEEELVKEWIIEIAAAAKHYLAILDTSSLQNVAKL